MKPRLLHSQSWLLLTLVFEVSPKMHHVALPQPVSSAPAPLTSSEDRAHFTKCRRHILTSPCSCLRELQTPGRLLSMAGWVRKAYVPIQSCCHCPRRTSEGLSWKGSQRLSRGPCHFEYGETRTREKSDLSKAISGNWPQGPCASHLP